MTEQPTQTPTLISMKPREPKPLWQHRSKYTRHQGAREMARRLRQQTVKAPKP